MKTTPIPTLLAAALVCGLMITNAHAQDKTPGFNQKIPAKIMTPDEVETRINHVGPAVVPTFPASRGSSAANDLEVLLTARTGGL